MKVDDRSPIAEHLIAHLWEQNYFSSIPLKTIDGQRVEIISAGIKNLDSGPDFKNIRPNLPGRPGDSSCAGRLVPAQPPCRSGLQQCYYAFSHWS